MVNFWRVVNDVIAEADVVLTVIDARLVEESRNIEVEEKILKAGKKIIIVVNKCDLVPKEYMSRVKKKIPNSVFVSAKDSLGTTILKKKILELGRHVKERKIVVGIAGYPNTGKSSIVNSLAGRSKARTSPQAGFTKGRQLVAAGPKIQIIDTPGVIPFKEDDEELHAIIAAKDFTQVKDPDVVAMSLIKMLNGRVEEFYGVKPEEHDDEYDILEKIAIAKHKLKKGAEADIDTMSRLIIRDWQRGEIK